VTAAISEASRVTYIPLMGDHAFALAAAMRHYGMPAEVLPPTDDRSMALGLRACGGRECLPCFLVMGDVLRCCEAPDFDPDAAAFYLPTASGPCRFGQYTMLLRDVLDARGLGTVPVHSPSTANSFQGFGERPRQIRQLAWQGMVAVDLLVRLQLEHRPYELEPGATDAVYRDGLGRAMAAVEAGGGRRLVDTMATIADAFGGLLVERTPRPVVGLVGEVYVRWNAYSNRNLIAEVERLGGEVMIASMAELIYFLTHRMKEVAWVSGRYGQLLRGMLVDVYQAGAERRLLRAVGHRLRRPDESPSRAVADAVKPFYDPVLGTEAVLSMGRAVEFARDGIHGILNVLPFSCMPGVVVGGMATRVRRELDWVPWLDLPYDAQKETNVRTRLEAFMHQAEQFRRRSGREPLRHPAGAV
jgi:predicted nucleotide-binding protein (sugar kinase/HSP70/actin superfamily)